MPASSVRQAERAAPFAHLMNLPTKIVEPTLSSGAGVRGPARGARVVDDVSHRRVAAALNVRIEDGDPDNAPAETDDERKDREEREREQNQEETGRAETDEERREREERERDQNQNEDAEDEEDEVEAKGAGLISEARARERARCATIFGVKEAGARPDLAAHLAFETTLPRHKAASLLRTLASGERPVTRSATLGRRMAETPIPDVGGGESPARPTGSAALAAQIIAAGKKRRGEA